MDTRTGSAPAGNGQVAMSLANLRATAALTTGAVFSSFACLDFLPPCTELTPAVMSGFLDARDEALLAPGCPAVFGLSSSMTSSMHLVSSATCRVGPAAKDGKGWYLVQDFSGALLFVSAGPDGHLGSKDDHGFDCPRGAASFGECAYRCDYFMDGRKEVLRQRP